MPPRCSDFDLVSMADRHHRHRLFVLLVAPCKPPRQCAWAQLIVHHHSQTTISPLRGLAPVHQYAVHVAPGVLGIHPYLCHQRCAEPTVSILDSYPYHWQTRTLEWVMNTPSHHRVHHGINPKYIDKNYAGVFIVWDLVFGTFERKTKSLFMAP